MAHDMIYKHYLDNIQVQFHKGQSQECPLNWVVEANAAEHNIFYYIAQGQFQGSINKMPFELSSGHLVLLPKGIKYSIKCATDGSSLFGVQFSAPCNDMDLFELITLPRRIKVDNSGEITQLMLDIMQLGKNEDLVSQLKQKSRLLKLITCFINASASVIHYENYDERIECIINYIQQNLAKTITINELAELSHLHPNYFIRFFKHKTGFAPMSFIADMRLNRAKDLLRNTDYIIADIATMVGINDYSYFSRQFKRNTGFSPSEYRQLTQKNQTITE